MTEVARSHAEDRALVAGILAGEEAALDEFGERYCAALFRFALGRLRGDRELARDIVQTTLAKALGRLASYRGEASLLTWLCACCRNEVLMHLRRHGSAPVAVEVSVLEALPGADGGPSAEATLLERERAERVHLVLDALPPRYACALEWKYVEHLSVEAIAMRLGLGLKAAESLLGRARQAFRSTFEDLGTGGGERGAMEGRDR